ncbi:FAD/NAD(P)-binding domain-containing protein [Coprinopsis marcescibilis]|uniref:FAD/NAD(P)-binding domain-containing protein n=1 Tax=Coprinopsis marcescibilis TaxID=230819 RepID=A0A5C3KBL0_COPMA|nr:FAD/NAD(P)-binding domain-containing protein [Coprinopsis marcescibilis]
MRSNVEDILSAPVCIIGTGVAGIISAHVLIQDGFKDVTLISRDKGVGGVWSKERVYEGLRTNSVHGEYRFSALDMKLVDPDKRERDHRLTGEHLCHYMEEYAQRFLAGKVKYMFQSDVKKLRREDDGKWLATVQDMVDGSSKELSFARVIVASGGTHSPKIPAALSSSSAQLSGFEGRLFHSSDFAKEEPTLPPPTSNEKRTVSCVVVGGGKSAQDLSALMTRKGYAVTIVYEHLDVFFASDRPVPDFVRKGRLLSVLSPYRELNTKLERFFHTTPIGATLVKKFWESLVQGSRSACGVPENSPLRLTPDAFWSISNNDEGIPRPDGFPALVNQGRLTVAAPFRATGFSKAGVLITDGRCLAADIVILATGYESSWSMFDGEMVEELGLAPYMSKDGLHDRWNYATLKDGPTPHPESDAWTMSIYRGIVPAKNILRRDFALAGALYTINPGYTFEVAAHWTSSYFLGDKMRLPATAEEAAAEAEDVINFGKVRFPQTPFWRHGSGGVTPDAWTWPQAADELLEDMYLETRRSGGNWLNWVIKAINVDELCNIGDERRRIREASC